MVLLAKQTSTSVRPSLTSNMHRTSRNPSSGKINRRHNGTESIVQLTVPCPAHALLSRASAGLSPHVVRQFLRLRGRDSSPRS